MKRDFWSKAKLPVYTWAKKQDFIDFTHDRDIENLLRMLAAYARSQK